MQDTQKEIQTILETIRARSEDPDGFLKNVKGFCKALLEQGTRVYTDWRLEQINATTPRLQDPKAEALLKIAKNMVKERLLWEAKDWDGLEQERQVTQGLIREAKDRGLPVLEYEITAGSAEEDLTEPKLIIKMREDLGLGKMSLYVDHGFGDMGLYATQEAKDVILNWLKDRGVSEVCVRPLNDLMVATLFNWEEAEHLLHRLSASADAVEA